jgi:hypothetical protein
MLDQSPIAAGERPANSARHTHGAEWLVLPVRISLRDGDKMTSAYRQDGFLRHHAPSAAPITQALDARCRFQDCFEEIARLFDAMGPESEASACAETREAALALRVHIRATAALASLLCAADGDAALRNCSALFGKPRHSLYALIGDFTGSAVRLRRRIAPQFIDAGPVPAAASKAEIKKFKQRTLREREVFDLLLRGHTNK